MKNKIAYIHGSPRKNGNTATLSRVIIRAARELEADVTEIEAAGLEFKIPGCISCMKCHQSDGFECQIDDQLAQTVAMLVDFDVIVLATPTYWMSYPAQVKMLIDRLGSLMKFNDFGAIKTPLAGKAFALLATGGGVVENNIDLLEKQWQSVAAMMSCRFMSCLFPDMELQRDAIAVDASMLKKASDFGRVIAQS